MEYWTIGRVLMKGLMSMGTLWMTAIMALVLAACTRLPTCCDRVSAGQGLDSALRPPAPHLGLLCGHEAGATQHGEVVGCRSVWLAVKVSIVATAA